MRPTVALLAICPACLLASPSPRAQVPGDERAEQPPEVRPSGQEAALIDRVVPRMMAEDLTGAARVLDTLRDDHAMGQRPGFGDALEVGVHARAGDTEAALEAWSAGLFRPDLRKWLVSLAAEGLLEDAPAAAALLASTVIGGDAAGRRALAVAAEALAQLGLEQRAQELLGAHLGAPEAPLRGLSGRLVVRIPPQPSGAAETERGWLLLEVFASRQAREAFARALSMPLVGEIRCWALIGAARAGLRRGDVEPARDLLAEAVRLCPAHPEIGDTAVRLARSAYTAHATETLNEAVRWARDHAPMVAVRNGLGALLALTQPSGQARALAKRVRSRLKASPWYDPVSAEAFAVWRRFATAGSYEMAAEVLEPLVAAGYRQARMSVWGREGYWLAWTRRRQGRTQQAAELFERTARDFPTCWYGLLSLAELEAIDAGRAEALRSAARDELAGAVRRALGPRWEATPRAATAVRRMQRLRRWGLVEAMHAEASAARLQDQPAQAAWAAERIARAGDPRGGSRLAERALARHGLSPLEGAHGLWRAAFPRPYRGPVEEAALSHDVDPLLVWAVMRIESRYNPNAVSSAGARGLLQLMPGTARWLSRRLPAAPVVRDLFDPPDNLRLGGRFLSRLARRYHGSLPLLLVAYNAGPGRASKAWREALERKRREVDWFVEELPWDQARRYTRSVVTSWATYQLLYGCRCLVSIDRELPLRDDGTIGGTGAVRLR